MTPPFLRFNAVWPVTRIPFRSLKKIMETPGIFNLTEYPLMGLMRNLLISVCEVPINEDSFGCPKE